MDLAIRQHQLRGELRIDRVKHEDNVFGQVAETAYWSSTWW